MKVLVTGANGQLGYDVVKRLKKNNIECLETDKNNLDITKKKQVKEIITKFKPNVVIHCAAYTSVDRAEDEKEICFKVNVLGTKNVAEVCKEIDAKLVYISTDYVFDGEGNRPFEVTDKPNPINYYGLTKYQGELEVQKLLRKYFIVRSSWIFGKNGNNFVKTMLGLGKERGEMSIVADQIGSPSYTFDLAKLLSEIIETEKYGVYHATNEGYCSWFEFACEIFMQAGMNVRLWPIRAEEYPTKVKRPRNSRLSKEILNSTRNEKLRDWKLALRDYLKRERS